MGEANFAFLVRLIRWIIANPVDQAKEKPEFRSPCLSRPMKNAERTLRPREIALLAGAHPAALAGSHSNAESRPLDIRRLRRRMHLTQSQFACYFGFSVATLRHWERGNRQPTGAALILLHVIDHHPRAVLLAARRARATLGADAPKLELSRSNRAPPGMACPI